MLKICSAFLLVMISAGPGPAGAGGTVEADTRPAGEDVFARKLVLNLSTAALYSVFESTSPEHDAAACLRRGVYRRELLILFAMARESQTTLKALVREREQGATLQALAGRKKLNLMKIFREAAALQEKIETEIAATAPAPDTSSRAVRAAVTDADVKSSTSPDK